MLHLCVASLALTAMASLGVALLRRFAGDLDAVESLAYGIPLGAVVSSLAVLGLASLFGLTGALVAIVGAGSAVIAIGLGRGRWRQSSSSLRAAFPLVVVCVLGAFTIRWSILFHGSLAIDGAGLWAGHRNIWADWAQHLGDITSFAYGDNFPPTHPRLTGAPFAYHYLTSVTTAAMVLLGITPITALLLHSFVFSLALLLSLYAFARRLSRQAGTAALAVTLFLLGGGLGWVVTVRETLRSHDAWRAFIAQPWDAAAQQAENFTFLNVFFSLLYPQRSFLYGLPLGLLVLTLLMNAVRDRERYGGFLLAGAVAGLLPFAHLGALLSLALITPFLFVLFPSKRWLGFFGAWVLVAVPQIYVQQGGGAGAAGAIRFQPGWVAAPDNWAWFWLKNLGAFVPLLGTALLDRRLLDETARRMLWAFMPVFVIANLVVFQPWAWDNSKVLVYWFLAVSILAAAALTKMWDEYRAVAFRVFLVATVLTMTLSGLFENAEQLLGRDRRLLLTGEELGVADAVRQSTPPHAIFAAGLQHNHPVPVLSGRRVVMGYPGWMWSQGANTVERERDLRAIMALSPAAPELMTKYGVSYVVIGPYERDKMGADLDGYRRAYRSVLRTDNYDVFDVKGAPAASTSSSTTTSGSRRPGE